MRIRPNIVHIATKAIMEEKLSLKVGEEVPLIWTRHPLREYLEKKYGTGVLKAIDRNAPTPKQKAK